MSIVYNISSPASGALDMPYFVFDGIFHRVVVTKYFKQSKSSSKVFKYISNNYISHRVDFFFKALILPNQIKTLKAKYEPQAHTNQVMDPMVMASPIGKALGILELNKI